MDVVELINVAAPTFFCLGSVIFTLFYLTPAPVKLIALHRDGYLFEQHMASFASGLSVHHVSEPLSAMSPVQTTDFGPKI
jgi:hypothetical protein